MTVVMTAVMVMGFSIFVNADNSQLAADYTGKTVILSTNDVHGSIDGYQYAAGLRKELTDRGADVIMVDAGDYVQGSSFVSADKGRIAVKLMVSAGYDYITVGNHEFDYGFDKDGNNYLDMNLQVAEEGGIEVLCCNILKDDTNMPKYLASDIYTDPQSGLKIGFVGVATPETQSKSTPGNFSDCHFPSNEEKFQVIQSTVNELRDNGADVVVAITHLGVDEESAPEKDRSIDMLANVTGIDLVLDGHSHTVMEEGDNGEPIMSTGTKFMNIGVTVVDESKKAIDDRFLFHVKEVDDKGNVKKDDQGNDVYCSDLTSDREVGAEAQEVIDKITEEYGVKIAESKVELNGDKGDATKPGNRVGETNNGDLIADAMLWYMKNSGNYSDIDFSNVVVMFNGGSIKAWVRKGDVTKKNIFDVLPFGNTIYEVKVTGAQLLEVLEASTYVTPVAFAGFPQIAGMNITIDTLKYYDAGELYPKTTYRKPNSIRRVTINDVNGEPFDENKEYVIVTSNFCADGGDTYFALSECDQFDTGYMIDIAVDDYIINELGGVIDETYKDPQGRIGIKTKATPEEAASAINNLPSAVTEDCRKQVEEARRLFSSLTPEEQSSMQLEAARLEAAEAKLDAFSANASAFEAKTEADKANEGLQAAQETIEILKDEVVNLTAQIEKLNVQSQKITGLKVKAKKGGKAEVTYRSLGDGYNYMILRSTSKSSGYKTVSATTKTKITVKGMKKGKTYYYKVKAYKEIDGKKVYCKDGSAVKVKAK